MSAPNSAAQAIACVEFESIAIGYAGLAQIAELDVEIAEASVVGGARFMIVLRGESATLIEAVRVAQKAASGGADVGGVSIETEILSVEALGFHDAMYSLAPQKLDETLVVCEASSMSALFSAATALLGADHVRAIEAKPLRGPRGGALGFFTGPATPCGLAAEAARSRWKAAGQTGRIECIDRPNARFREHFNLDGRA